MQKKIILAVTGIRSDYFIIKPLLKSFINSGIFEVKVVVSGAHLSEYHGFTKQIIESDGFEIVDEIDSLLNTNRNTQRVKGIGFLTTGLAQTVERVNPDFLFVLGDREESIVTALVGNYMDKLVIHVGGGDPVYGNSDDPIRFAVSKLAHIHLTTCTEYQKNLINIGEESFRVKFIGNPAYDEIRTVENKSLDYLSKELNFSIQDDRFVIFLKHPLSSEVDQTKNQIEIAINSTLEFADENDFKVICIYPNTDPGSDQIINCYKNIKSNRMKVYKTLDNDVFINCLRNAKALIGNSSMGILEAPYYKLPVVNIGNRQKGRLNAGNVEFVNYNKEEIKTSIKKACIDTEYRKKIESIVNPYGDGFSSQKAIEVIKEIEPNDKKWRVKSKLC